MAPFFGRERSIIQYERELSVQKQAAMVHIGATNRTRIQLKEKLNAALGKAEESRTELML